MVELYSGEYYCEGGEETYQVCQNIFDFLYSNSKVFKDIMDSKHHVYLTFKRDLDSKQLELLVSERKTSCTDYAVVFHDVEEYNSGLSTSGIENLLNMFKTVNDVSDPDFLELIFDKKVVELRLSDIFKYEKGCEFEPEIGVVIVGDEDEGVEEKTIILTDTCLRKPIYRNILDLRPEYQNNDCFVKTKVPLHFRNLLDRLRKVVLRDCDFSGCYGTPVKLHMVEERLKATVQPRIYFDNPCYDVVDSRIGGLYDICVDIIEDLETFSKKVGPVKEVTYLPLGEGILRYKKEDDGEYTLVVR